MRVNYKDVKKLDLITIKLEKIRKIKTNRITKDMLWLTQKLREVFIVIEKGTEKK